MTSINLEYLINKDNSGIILVSPYGNTVTLSFTDIELAINLTHSIVDKFKEFEVDVFSILGMRNLSAFIGELFASCVIKVSGDLFVKNPHQDGYPDLLLMDDKGKEIWASLAGQLQDKNPFSPFINGGIEVKATCGAVPTPAQLVKKGLLKPEIGDQRIEFLTGYDWKAHHRETNNLLGIVWDFIDKMPRITAVFFSNNLTEMDWGRIVQPKENGGRTTSVSIMTRNGIKKMYEGSIIIINDTRYTNFFKKYNKT